MNIGDKVRLVHGKEEGVIYAFLPGNVVEIEIEDGFRIPVMKNEIVAISPMESQRMVKDQDLRHAAAQSQVIVPRNKPFKDKGIYLVFVSVNDRTLSVHVVNDTDWQLPFSAVLNKEKSVTGLAAGTLEPKSSRKLTELEIANFENWPVFEFKMLYFREGEHAQPEPLVKKVKCRAQTFYKSKGRAPVLNKEGYLYQLDIDATLTYN